MGLTIFGSQFDLGHIFITRCAKREVHILEAYLAIKRHSNGDWGEVCEADRGQNDLALKNGDRLLSRYVTHSGTVFWIITESDRSYTTILLPSDY